jgi:outer membrane lipoprotein-sorting protein
MNYLLSIILLLVTLCVQAQTPKQRIALVNQKFNKVADYSADIHLHFAIPSVKLGDMNGKVFFKKPTKFRIRVKGIAFLPKQNPYYSLAALADTNSYTAINTGEEKVGTANAVIIQVLPNGGENDLILGKFWIDKAQNLILKSQLTTKSAGTIQIENSYGANASMPYGLPDLMTLTVDMSKFRVPKMVSADINSKSSHPAGESRKGTGVITLQYSHYAVNSKVPDAVFTEDAGQ